MSTMPSMFARLSRSNSTISSSRFRNSGRKCARTAAITWSRASSASTPSGSIDSAWLPRFEVRMISVFLKSTTRPCPSVSRPSSSTCSSTLNTSGCAFSTSSNSSTW